MTTPKIFVLFQLGGKQSHSGLRAGAGKSRPGNSVTRLGTLLAIVMIFSAIFTAVSYSSSSTPTRRSQAGSLPQASYTAANPVVGTMRKDLIPNDNLFLRNLAPAVDLSRSSFLSLLLPPPPAEETIGMFASDCTTPKTDFNFGETVCAVVSNARLAAGERLIWGHTDGYLAREVDVTSVTQTDSLTLTPTSLLGGEVFSNRGTWKCWTIDADGAAIAVASFTIHDPAAPTSDLAVYKNPTSGSGVNENTNVSFSISVTNHGPDPAQNVVLTDVVPSAATFVSLTPDAGGPGFSCDGSVCTIATLARGAIGNFTAVYLTNGVASTTVDTYSASVSSDVPPTTGGTDELHPADNTASGEFTINVDGAPPTACDLVCPGDVVVTANATQSGQPGRFVTYSAASVSGDCGSIVNSPASGSFLTVTGSPHTITSTADAGPSCTFTVTVLDSSSEPTISCPPNITVTAPTGADEATVNPGVPTTNVVGVDPVGVRSDGSPAVYDENGNEVTPAVVVPLNAPYPVGVTGILWTVTDANGRKATCAQIIKVNADCTGGDTENPTIEAPPDVTVGMGPDNTGCVVALSGELGQASAQDDCTATITVSGIPAGNEFTPGVYTITYTATDGVGNTASDTQTVTVFDDTPPVIVAPADASYTCLSEVPAANPSQATRGVVLDENGNPLPPGPPFDNCGTPAVTVTETSTGAGSAASPRIITRTFTATDGSPLQNSSSSVQTITVIDPTPPTFTSVPGTVIAYTGAGATSCGTVVSDATIGTATATDNCSVTVTRTGVPAGNNFPKGDTTITYTATDGGGNTATATQTVTVIDNTPPTITLSGANPQIVECHTSYPELGATANDNCSGSFAATPSGSVNVNVVGTYTISYNASDASGNAATPVTRTVIVQDTIAPTITLNSYAPSMWPPNHKYKTFQLTEFVTGASDSCNTTLGLGNVVIEKVTSDEIENGNGDGNTLNDIVIANNCKSVQLRSEREGNGNGRVYTITFKVSDGSNTTRVTAKVVVPHNPGSTVVDSGVHYTVNSVCP